MARDPRKLVAFTLADELVPDVYRATAGFPDEERFGLQSQIRRAAVSVAANVVEGCARWSERDYRCFVVIALGSASETRYLVDVAARLGFIEPHEAASLDSRYQRVVRALQGLVDFLRVSRRPRTEDRRPRT